MRELDKNKIYDLSELTSDEFTELIDYLKKNYWNWEEFIKIHDGYTLSFDKEHYTWYQGIKKPTANAKELFGYKEKSKEFKKLVEVLNEELTEEAYKETEYEVKYIAEKPQQYQIGIDTFERCEANMTKEEILACVRFNIDKYNWRNKGQDLEDLEKIISYANWGIKQLKQQ